MVEVESADLVEVESSDLEIKARVPGCIAVVIPDMLPSPRSTRRSVGLIILESTAAAGPGES